MSTPKPWETGYTTDQLPVRSAKRKPSAPDSARRKGGIGKFHGKATQLQDKQTRSKAAKKAATTRKRKKFELVSANKKFSQRNFDPMDLLISVAEGKAMYDDHPFLPILQQYLDDIQERFEFQDGFGVVGLLQQLRVEGQGYLYDSYTPKEHRIKVATELMQYARPKLKQTEFVNKGDENCGQATPLTKEEVIMFKEWFDNEF